MDLQPSGAAANTTQHIDGDPMQTGDPDRVRSQAAPMFSATLLDHFDSQFRKAWQENRASEPPSKHVRAAEAAFREAVLEMPSILGEQHASDLSKLEEWTMAMSDGDGLGLLAGIESGSWKPSGKDVTVDLMEKVFSPRVTGSKSMGQCSLRTLA